MRQNKITTSVSDFFFVKNDHDKSIIFSWCYWRLYWCLETLTFVALQLLSPTSSGAPPPSALVTLASGSSRSERAAHKELPLLERPAAATALHITVIIYITVYDHNRIGMQISVNEQSHLLFVNTGGCTLLRMREARAWRGP